MRKRLNCKTDSGKAITRRGGSMEKSDSFASDVVKQVLKDYRRFIIILIVFIFVNNIAWLIAWNYPSIRGEQVQVESDEGNANYIGEDGEISNGK